MYVCDLVSSSRLFSLQQRRLGSVAEESSLKASAETIVGHFAVSVVSYNTVVAGLLDGVSDDGRADIRSAGTDFRHGLVLVLLHAAHALLGGSEEPRVLGILFLSALLLSGHPDESLALLCGRRFFI